MDLFKWFRKTPPAFPTPGPRVYRGDGWTNESTGLGTGRDKGEAGYFSGSLPILDRELEDLYTQDDISAKIVDYVPREAFRRGYELGEGFEGAEEKAKALGLNAALLECWILARLYGGALLIFGTGGDPAQPMKKGEEVKYLTVLDRRWVQPATLGLDPLLPTFGKPEQYRVWNGALVHASRVLRMDGAYTDLNQRVRNQGWGNSVLLRVYNSVRAFSTAFSHTAYLMHEAGVGVLKLQGLYDILAAENGEERLRTRVALQDNTRSTMRSLVLDAENEEYTRTNTTFSGLDGLLETFMLRVSSAAEMPQTILFGRSPAGQNATGESDFRHFYANVASEQENTLLPALQRCYEVLGAPGVEVSFKPLWEPTDGEQAALELQCAQRDQIYIQEGVLPAESVALKRFGRGYFSLDLSLTEEENAAFEKGLKQALTEPPPEPVTPAPVQEPPPNAEPIVPA